MTTIRADTETCRHEWAQVPAMDRLHCTRCGKSVNLERTVRRGLLWFCAAALVALWALSGPWAAMVAEIGR